MDSYLNRGLKLKPPTMSFSTTRHVYHENRHPIQPLVAAPVFVSSLPSKRHRHAVWPRSWCPRSATLAAIALTFHKHLRFHWKCLNNTELTWVFNITHAQKSENFRQSRENWDLSVSKFIQQVHPWKLTWHWKNKNMFNREYIFIHGGVPYPVSFFAGVALVNHLLGGSGLPSAIFFWRKKNTPKLHREKKEPPKKLRFWILNWSDL